MSIFNGRRLTNATFKLDIERMRRGWYSDKYFENVSHMFEMLNRQGYQVRTEGGPIPEPDVASLPIGDMQVEMQWFTRRKPRALVAGVDKALSMLYHCAGVFDEQSQFLNGWTDLQVEAVQDGVFVQYDGDPMQVQPALKVRGPYRAFAILETPMLGILSRASRIATNVYNTLVAAQGKPVLFFPARFDVHEVQAADGYAYDIAVQRYNRDHDRKLQSFVSTDAQGDWWGGFGGGTVPHAVIACFLGNTAEAMMCFAATQPSSVPRIALVDFNNDCVGTSLDVAKRLFEQYRVCKQQGNDVDAEKYRLFGVRLDTSANMRDVSLEPLGDPLLDLGVNPRLVTAVRSALDDAWTGWDVKGKWRDEAEAFCRGVRIVVSGGFSPEKITRFERLGVPVDIYGVGSSLMMNDANTNTDFTADVTAVKLDGHWASLAKVGRQACDNPDLELIAHDYVEKQEATAAGRG
jgi:nicotinate phosphoribosyltransferase